MGRIFLTLLTDDEQLLLKRCEELFSRAEKGIASSTRFLNPRERYIIEHRLSSYFADDESEPLCFFYGGFPSAVRCALICMPSYARYSLTDGSYVGTVFKDELSEITVALRIKAGGYVKLSHRDYLGSLIALGIDRPYLGDILTDSEGATVFVSPSVAELIKNELTYIGRDKVKVTDITLPDDFDFVPEFEKTSGTVASARLDAVVSELARTSRENAKLIIKQGLVEHNYFTADEADTTVESTDTISIRKTSGTKGGKFVIDSIDSLTSKGRIRLEARRFT